MPAAVPVPGLAAFSIEAGPESPTKKPKATDAAPDARSDAALKGLQQQLTQQAALVKALQQGGAKAPPGGEATRKATPQGTPQTDYTDKPHGFEDGGKVFFIGQTKYDAAAARKEYGNACCLPYILTKGLPGGNRCAKPGDPAHGDGGAAHTKPEGTKSRTAFNVSHSGGKGKGKGKGDGGSKGRGGGKGKGDGGGKGRGNGNM